MILGIKINLDLSNLDDFEKINNVFRNIIIFDDIDGAINFYKNLEKLLRDYKNSHRMIDLDLLNEYKKMIYICKWIGVVIIPEEEIADLIDKIIKDLLSDKDILIWDKLRVKLRSIFILEDRDKLKKTIKEHLDKNNIIITNKKLIIDKIEKIGNVSNWLAYYNMILGIDKISNIKINEFFNNDNNIKKLSKQEKDMVIRLFKFYEKLKHSSFSFQGIEDQILIDNGIEKVWVKEGEITPYKLNETVEKRIDNAENILRKALGNDYYKFFGERVDKNIKESGVQVREEQKNEGQNIKSSNKLLNNYKIISLDWQKVNELIKNLDKIYNEQNKFVEMFHQAINSRDKEGIVAGLMLLAKKGHLDEIFERDKKIMRVFKDHLAKQFSSKLAKDLQLRPKEPVYLSYFLQHLLKDILKLSENESAVLAIKLVNELKRAGDKQYMGIAYGDLQSETFKWKDIMEKDNKLELM